MAIYELDGVAPRVAASAWVAENAQVMGDVSIGEDAVGYAIAAWMIIVMGVAMGLYWLVRKRAERWKV